MSAETSVERTAFSGTFHSGNPGLHQRSHTISDLLPGFLRFAEIEMSLSPQTIAKYRDCLQWVIRDLGNLPAETLSAAHITDLKHCILARGAGEARIASMVFALRSFLRYCAEELELAVLPVSKVRPPKRRRREVIFLTNEEVDQFVSSIKLTRFWRVKPTSPAWHMDGLRFRTLVEVLLGTGMRISEALALDRTSIDFGRREAKIIGKGSKERTVFFSERSLVWAKRYLEARTDDAPALFITQKGTRCARADTSGMFRRYAKRAGLQKKVTPHILRHTMATNLLFNGCPIAHVKEILGHDLLETTCKYYLGVDKTKAREAHATYLSFV